MLTSINVGLKDVRKTAIVNDEVIKLEIDIATLQKTRLAETGIIKEKDYTFYLKSRIVMNAECMESFLYFMESF